MKSLMNGLAGERCGHVNTLRKKTNGTRNGRQEENTPQEDAAMITHGDHHHHRKQDRDRSPFDDPPKWKYKSVGVITSGGGADYKPKRKRKKVIPASPKARSDSESDTDSSESEDGNDNDPPPARKDPPPDDDEPPRRTATQAPWRPIRSPSKRSAFEKDNEERREHKDDDTMSQGHGAITSI
jgi:hypothetical protein